MTPEEWQTSESLELLLRRAYYRASDRKRRLLACALARRVWDRIAFPESRAAIAVAEEYADGVRSATDLHAAGGAARTHPWDFRTREGRSAIIGIQLASVNSQYAAVLVSQVARDFAITSESPDAEPLRQAESRAQCDLLRDILGSPFHPISIDPALLDWRGGLIPELAGAIYEERAFDRMPYLGDALEEAGCDRPEILDHCRSGAAHVRGCWVVDALLGKA